MFSYVTLFSCLIGFILSISLIYISIYAENAKFDKGTIIIAEDPFYQSINGTVTSTRILNVEGILQSEVSFFENALINGNITILNQGTFFESIIPNKIIGNGKGIISYNRF